MDTLTNNETMYLEEILHLSVVIGRRLARIEYDKTAFSEDAFIRDSFIPPLMHIGKAVDQLSPEVADAITDGGAEALIGMSDRLEHAYIGIDNDRLWLTVTKQVPQLGLATAHVLAELVTSDVSEDVAFLQTVRHTVDERFPQLQEERNA